MSDGFTEATGSVDSTAEEKRGWYFDHPNLTFGEIDRQGNFGWSQAQLQPIIETISADGFTEA